MRHRQRFPLVNFQHQSGTLLFLLFPYQKNIRAGEMRMRPSILLALLIIYCWCFSTCLGQSRRVSDITVACFFDDSHLLDSCLVACPLGDGALNVT